MHRRHFLGLGAAAVASLAARRRGRAAAATPTPRPGGNGWKVGMCCWNMRDFDPTVFSTAAQIGLDGVQLGISNTDQQTLKLRRPEVQREYIEAARRAGVSIVGTACQYRKPLKTDPVAALILNDWIEVTRALGARVILVPFFGKPNIVDVNVKEEFDRLVAVLRELGPRAERAGVLLGLENTLSAGDNRKILDAVASPAVKVYYDIGNSTHNGYPIVEEIRALGKERICEFHIKDNPNLLGEGQIDLPAVAQAIRDIGFEDWLVLETSTPHHDLIADTKANLAYVRRVFTRR